MIRPKSTSGISTKTKLDSQAFAEQVLANQSQLSTHLKDRYDFIVCGSGSSGSVVAARLAENPDVSVLLLEAGGSDNVPSVLEAAQWPLNLGSERDWGFVSQPEKHLKGRRVPQSMGKVLGGGSSINVMTYARGHKVDWDYFASEANDDAWSYSSVLDIYQRIEDWAGAPDPEYRGVGGPLFIQPTPYPSPITRAMLEGANAAGLPTFENQNGTMMEAPDGASIIDMTVRDGKRQSVFRSYVYPLMNHPNLTVLTGALVTRIVFDGKRAAGVEVQYDGRFHRFGVNFEVVLSLGAVHTPKLLMQSGIGDYATLEKFGVPVIQHLPGVGQNFQDHVALGCIWEYPEEQKTPRNTVSEATCFFRSDPAFASPDLQLCHGQIPVSSAETAVRFNTPPDSWTFLGGVVQPKSRGQVLLSGPNPDDPVLIETNMLAHPDDLKAAIACVEFCREVGNSAPLRPFVKREVMPGNLKGAELEDFVRDAAVTYWHQTCTAKMGRDEMSVVDGRLGVYGIENLRVADGSIMPRVTTGNTMAPCIVIGERAGEILKREHNL